LLLSLRPAALLRETALARGGRRPRRSAASRHLQRPRDAFGEAFERQLAVARLRARVLCHGDDARPETLDDALALGGVERPGGDDVEYRFHARGGHVRVLAARARGAA